MEADGLEVTILMENWVDMLLPPTELPGTSVQRYGLFEHFDTRTPPPIAENGLSLLIRVTRGEHETTILFDAGLTPTALLHNLATLNIDVNSIDQIVLSHGHPDHYGGIEGVLRERASELTVVTHPDAFSPRFAVLGDGRVASYYNRRLTRRAITEAGGALVETRDSLNLGLGALTTGEIPRTVDFEAIATPISSDAAGLYQIGTDGRWNTDLVLDEQGLAVNVRGLGLIVFTGCAHAGVINTVRRCQELSGQSAVHAIIGGFHLGFPTTPLENVRMTVDAMVQMDASVIMPMHCSGLASHVAFLDAFVGRYIQPAVGSTIRFGERLRS